MGPKTDTETLVICQQIKTVTPLSHSSLDLMVPKPRFLQQFTESNEWREPHENWMGPFTPRPASVSCASLHGQPSNGHPPSSATLPTCMLRTNRTHVRCVNLIILEKQSTRSHSTNHLERMCLVLSMHIPPCIQPCCLFLCSPWSFKPMASHHHIST